MPAAALLALAVWVLVRNADRHPLGAPVLFGLVLGLAAYVRAIALPLAALAVLHFRARGARWVHAITRTVAACLVAFLVLLPWGIRNVRRYGEFFLTDSHGGHTALVGANPDTDGVYSRSLNRMFAEGTGYRLFAEPHREADRAAYRLAKQWTAFEPKYALGLLAAKADRLLTNERPLLYWPLYRQSVLPDGSATKSWFDRHRAGIERLVDGFWYALVAAALIGVVAAAARRNWSAMSLLPLPLALAVLYTAFFAEVRYHLAIVALLFPFAGAGVDWLGEAVHDLARRAIDRHRRPHLIVEAVGAAFAIAITFLGWPRLIAAGARLRDTHRWAVSVCSVEKSKRLCSWKMVQPPPGSASSPLRGVWDGVGLRLAASPAAAETALDLAPGRYRIGVRADIAPVVDAARGGSAAENAEVVLSADGAELARAPSPTDGAAIPLMGVVTHAGGKLQIQIRVTGDFLPDVFPQAALWISDIAVETDGA
jgi:hypothetical protein